MDVDKLIKEVNETYAGFIQELKERNEKFNKVLTFLNEQTYPVELIVKTPDAKGSATGTAFLGVCEMTDENVSWLGHRTLPDSQIGLYFSKGVKIEYSGHGIESYQKFPEGKNFCATPYTGVAHFLCYDRGLTEYFGKSEFREFSKRGNEVASALKKMGLLKENAQSI